MKKIISFLMSFCLLFTLWGEVGGGIPKVQATTAGALQDQIKKDQKHLDSINSQIASLEDEQDLLEEQIEDLNSEIVNAMASIDMKEEEIQQKTAEIEQKQQEIEQTQKDYDEAVQREEAQKASMAFYTRMMYENDDRNYLGSMLAGQGLSDILNKMDYVERIYEYCMKKLQEYMDTKDEVRNLWDKLEQEKAGFVDDKTALEADKLVLQSLKSELDVSLNKKKKESANYEAEIKKARQEAAVAKKLLQQDKEKLRKLTSKPSQPSVTNTPSNYVSVIDGAAGSDLGRKIAKYGCQFIGNPYVPGGTSLTNGADCSGFTYRIYQDFGYSIPRTSYEQRSAGKGVSYSEAQPGDLICYDGHVAMYIGGGMIVHASTQKTGIKVSMAQYRTILAVRRII